MWERIKSMLIKEFIQMFRDPRMRGIIFIVPMIQTLLFGYAVTMDVNHVNIGVYDLDNSVESRKIIDAFAHSGYFFVVKEINQTKELEDFFDHSLGMAVLRFNKGFSEEIKENQSAPIQVILDGTESNTAGIVFSYIGSITEKQSQQILIDRLGHLFKRQGISLESRAWFNPNLESRNFYVPGVVAILLTLMTLTLTSMAIVREKEVGTIEQIIVSPITSIEFILGKTIPFIIVGFIEVCLILIVALYWFEVPFRGSFFLFFIAIGLYLLTTLGIGLFISTVSQTQQQAMMSALLFYMPAVLLSGFIFPVANMPGFIQMLTFFNPLKYFLIIIRSIFLKGLGISILWPQLLVLGGMGIIILWLSSSRFNKKLS